MTMDSVQAAFPLKARVWVLCQFPTGAATGRTTSRIPSPARYSSLSLEIKRRMSVTPTVARQMQESAAP
jgi:hypothetical protein